MILSVSVWVDLSTQSLSEFGPPSSGEVDGDLVAVFLAGHRPHTILGKMHVTVELHIRKKQHGRGEMIHPRLDIALQQPIAADGSVDQVRDLVVSHPMSEGAAAVPVVRLVMDHAATLGPTTDSFSGLHRTDALVLACP
ncbi:hypothetical protein [Luteococcus sp.]|uniref:hypothetical protein n=1 Tax=Luteococcus sp. TaxID=1969402 RepID=UPI0037353096